MDTNKENELMAKLEKKTPKLQAAYRADGVPTRPGVASAAVNPPTPTGGNASSQASLPQSDSARDVARVTPEMVNRIEMYGVEAVFDAREDN